MAQHDGFLYVATYKWTVLLPYLPIDKWPPGAAELVRRIGIDRIAREDAGFELWRSPDGVRWDAVTLDGFGNPYNYGARTLLSTPLGLVVGTANPFGPDVARCNGDGWRYGPNPRGGLEIWLGAPAAGHEPVRPPAIRLMNSLSRWPADNHLDSQRGADDLNRRYDEWMYTPLAQEYYGGSDFFNFGYWTAETRDQRQASENLMERLLGFLPKKGNTILDVACGKGATTRHLLKYYEPSRITGINISEKQLAKCRANAPGCRFLVMDATRLRFPDESFDTVICVEAALHFNTREQFVQEAFRVLRPRGHLLMSDILMRPGAESWEPLLHRENYVSDVAQYQSIFRRTGFAPVVIEDATERCAEPYFRHIAAYLRRSLASGALDWPTFSREMTYNLWIMDAMTFYVLVCARKPVRH